MSMFSSDANSMNISIENAFFIIGPSMRVISKDDSYLQESEKELCEPYDETNAFNIFANNLKLKKKPKDTSLNSATGPESANNEKKPEAESKCILIFLLT